MALVLHILRKDLRRYRWAWLALIGFSLIEILLYGTRFGLADSNGLKALESLTGSGIVLIGFFLMVLVVQEEPLGDPDASWVARPIPRLSLLAAKWLFCLLVIALLNAATAAVILILNDGAARAVFPFVGIAGVAIYIAFQILLAAQTQSLPRYLASVAGLILAFWVGGYLIIGFLFDELFFEMPSLLPATFGDTVVLWIQTFWWLTLGTGAGVFYYKTRNRWGMAGILAAGAICAIFLTRQEAPKPFPSPAPTYSEGMEVVGDQLIKTGSGHISRIGGYTIFGVDIDFPGIKPHGDLVVEFVFVMVQQNGKPVPIEHMAYLGQLRDLPISESPNRYRISLFNLADDQLAELGQGPLEVYFRLRLLRKTEGDRELARVPLDDPPHIVYEGNRISITGRRRFDDRLNIHFRHAIPRFAYEPLSRDWSNRYESSNFAFTLLEKSTGETFDASVGRLGHGNLTGISAGESTLRFHIPTAFDETGAMLVVRERRLEQVGSYSHRGEFTLPSGGGTPVPRERPDGE